MHLNTLLLRLFVQSVHYEDVELCSTVDAYRSSTGLIYNSAHVRSEDMPPSSGESMWQSIAKTSPPTPF